MNREKEERREERREDREERRREDIRDNKKGYLTFSLAHICIL